MKKALVCIPLFLLLAYSAAALDGALEYGVETPYGFYALTADDVNSDGHDEIILGGGYAGRPATENRVRVLTYNEVTNSFDEVYTSDYFLGGSDPSYGSSYLSDIKIGDLDGDGKKDILSTVHYSAFVLENTGGYNFAKVWEKELSTTSNSLAIGDPDSDGVPNFLISGQSTGQIEVYENKADNLYALETTIGSCSGISKAVLVGDFDNDGKNDIFQGCPSSHQVIYEYNGLSYDLVWNYFGLGHGPYESIADEDFDKDSKIELAVPATEESKVYLFENTGDNTYVNTWTSGVFPFERKAFNVVASDLDLDGVEELIVPTMTSSINNGEIYIYKPNMDGTFSLVWQSGENLASSKVVVSDIDSDGKKELIAWRHNRDQNRYWLKIYQFEPVDNDGDGYGVDVDCNDNDPTIHPGATELCDGIDNNCNDQIDEGFNVGETCTGGIGACQSSGQYVCTQDKLGTECNALPGPPAQEVCNLIDDDCDGLIDDSLGQTTCGLGICLHTTDDCINGQLQVCNPFEGASVEKCNNLDDDCDGLTDEDLGQTTCGLGVCGHTVNNCVDGQVQICNPFQGASLEIPGNNRDENCDGIAVCDSSATWKNHGQYVSCVTKEVAKLVIVGELTPKQGAKIISDAAKSDVGKK